MEKKSYVVAIDLGTSNVVVAVGETTTDKKLKLLAVTSSPSAGVEGGQIVNIALVGDAVDKAVDQIETSLNIRITEAYIGVSGDFIRCSSLTDHVFATDDQNGICQADVDAIFDRMRNVKSPAGEIIMEINPQSYTVDNGLEVKNPIGSFGRKLYSTFNFTLCEEEPLNRFKRALTLRGINPLKVFSGAMTTYHSVVTPDEKEDGVAVVDLGAGKTDVCVIYKDTVRYIASIPMGGDIIDQDIQTMGVLEKHIETLKHRYGSALADLIETDMKIRVPFSRQRFTEILLSNLATAIEARLMDIAEFVRQEIKDSGFSHKIYSVVLTGGGAKLKSVDELFRRTLKMDVRIATPTVNIEPESQEIADDAAHSNVIGLLLRGLKEGECNIVERQAPLAQPAQQSTAFTPPVAQSTPAQQPVAQPQQSYQPTPTPQDEGLLQPKPITAQGQSTVEPEAPQSSHEQEEYQEPASKPKRESFLEKIKRKAEEFNNNFGGADDEEV